LTPESVADLNLSPTPWIQLMQGENKFHKPPMTGNGKFIPPIYLWLRLGDVYDDIAFPTLAGLLGQLHIKTKKNPQVTWLKSTRLGIHTAAR